MRIRTAVATLGAALGLAALGAGVTAGQAGALTPYNEPELGIVGVDLSPSDTVALANSPLPQLLDPVFAGAVYGQISLEPGHSEFSRGNPGGFSGFVGDAARTREVMGIMLIDGKVVLVYRSVS